MFQHHFNIEYIPPKSHPIRWLKTKINQIKSIFQIAEPLFIKQSRNWKKLEGAHLRQVDSNALIEHALIRRLSVNRLLYCKNARTSLASLVYEERGRLLRIVSSIY